MNEALRKAVIEQLGYEGLDEECKDDLKQVAEHGAAGGYGKFAYYSETVKFFNDNRNELLELLKEKSEEFGECGMIGMVRSFNCLNDNYSEDEIGEVLFDTACENDAEVQVKNAMAWFALEDLAYKIQCEGEG